MQPEFYFFIEALLKKLFALLVLTATGVVQKITAKMNEYLSFCDNHKAGRGLYNKMLDNHAFFSLKGVLLFYVRALTGSSA